MGIESIFESQKLQSTMSISEISSSYLSSLNSTTNIDNKKQSLDSARFSTDAAFKDKSIKDGVVRGLSGILGILVLSNSINNLREDFKNNKIDFWIVSRVIVDFTASGALIGYAFNNVLFGILIGAIVGLIALIVELVSLKKKNASRKQLRFFGR
jgi:acid phosphatase family membrane protein YuiD